MNSIEDFMNKLTDMDWGWWPVAHLRPAKDQYIDNNVLLKISPIFGSFLAVLIFLDKIPTDLFSMLTGLIVCWIVFFIGYKFTFAIAWNRRATRLQKLYKETS